MSNESSDSDPDDFQISDLNDEIRSLSRTVESLVGILHKAKLCYVCGAGATYELQYITGPMYPVCDEHSHPVARLSVRRKMDLLNG